MEDPSKIEVLALARKTNALAVAAVKTNEPVAAVTEPPAAPPDEWTPALTAYVAPKDAKNLWPVFLIVLLLVLVTELMRRHRRTRRARRFSQS